MLLLLLLLLSNQHLPAHLAQAIAQLSSLQPVGGRHRGPQMQLPVIPHIPAPLVRTLVNQY